MNRKPDCSLNIKWGANIQTFFWHPVSLYTARKKGNIKRRSKECLFFVPERGGTTASENFECYWLPPSKAMTPLRAPSLCKWYGNAANNFFCKGKCLENTSLCVSIPNFAHLPASWFVLKMENGNKETACFALFAYFSNIVSAIMTVLYDHHCYIHDVFLPQKGRIRFLYKNRAPTHPLPTGKYICAGNVSRSKKNYDEGHRAGT